MATEALRERGLSGFHSRGEPAALDHIDVTRRQLTAPKELETPTRPAGHAHRFLQVRGQTLYRSAIEAAGGRIAQPDPSGLDAKQIGHAPERLPRRPLLGRRAIESFSDFFQDSKRSRL